MATYTITNSDTRQTRRIEATGWDDSRLERFTEELDADGYNVYEVELECDHYDSRQCEALGHAGGK